MDLNWDQAPKFGYIVGSVVELCSAKLDNLR